MKNILLAALLFFTYVLDAQDIVVINVEKPKEAVAVAPDMYGIFFEDINFAADGGLYAELIKNRSFDFPNSPVMGWLTYGITEVRNGDGPFRRNPNYLRMTHTGLLTGTGIINEGFRGIGVEKDKHYNLRFYARRVGEENINLKVELVSAANMIIANGDLEVSGENWTEYELQLTASQTCSKAKMRIALTSKGTMDIEHVSLFPEDTWKGRKNGLRKDLAQALYELRPGVFRFPGGCIIEGNNLETRYQWKHSVGPAENRPVNENRWNYEFQHRFTPDYFQSYGLGFFEYFLLAEDLGAEPLPVVNAGMACQYATTECVSPEELGPYIDDALDLIEFANGPVTSTWGKVRAEMGHPEPFNMKYIGIGNEQWGEVFPLHLEAFQKAIKQRYPEIIIIGSSGPAADGKQFDYLWGEMKRLKIDLVDEHYYKNPEWFLTNAARYDSYDRNGPLVFAGEYACHVPDRKNSFYSALCEAAFLTGIERNSDVVRLATYAPLFAHVDAWQWKPDMIWYDNLRSVRSANYYVQQLYRLYQGTHVMQVKSEGKNVTGQQDIYASVVTDENSNQLIIKIANTNKKEKSVNIDLNLENLPADLKGKKILLKAAPGDENTLEAPDLVKPAQSDISFKGKRISMKIEPESFQVLVLEI
jgi:alpha-L-arabinofuranosidase